MQLFSPSSSPLPCLPADVVVAGGERPALSEVEGARARGVFEVNRELQSLIIWIIRVVTVTNLLIKNIFRLVTMEPCDGRIGPLGVIENAAVRVSNGKIVWVGKTNQIPPSPFPLPCLPADVVVAGGERVRVGGDHEDIIDASGSVVMPGLVDCHTHIVHGGFRCNEFNLRSQGKTYQEIAAAGGGIMATVRATRRASFEELVSSAKTRLDEAIFFGTTTIEIKTGYGLDTETESKMTDVTYALGKSGGASVVGTFFGAHIVPPEYKDRRADYVRLVADEMLPHAAGSGVISACDVFIEDGAFTPDEARVISRAAKAHSLAIHLHVDQFSDADGGTLAAEIGALSADHLDHTSESGMRAMKKAGVVAVCLPGASFFAGRGHYPDARKMISLGSSVAIGSDYNPGTNPSLNLWNCATIAVTQMGLTCDEALLAITKNAALAIGLTDRGTIAVGSRADLIILDAPHEHFPLYRYNKNFVRNVIIGGRLTCITAFPSAGISPYPLLQRNPDRISDR